MSNRIEPFWSKHYREAHVMSVLISIVCAILVYEETQSVIMVLLAIAAVWAAAAIAYLNSKRELEWSDDD